MQVGVLSIIYNIEEKFLLIVCCFIKKSVFKMITDFFVIINFFTNHFYLKENQLIRQNGHKLVEFRQYKALEYHFPTWTDLLAKYQEF